MTGDLAEMMVATELIRRGYFVSKPLTNGAPYDLLVDTDDGVKKIQVKSANTTPTGALRIRLRSSKYHRGRTTVSYEGLVDFVVGVDCRTGDIFVVGSNYLSMAEVNIRTMLSKNGQLAKIRTKEEHALDSFFPSKCLMVRSAGFEPATSCV